MTESEWLAATEPHAMLEWLRDNCEMPVLGGATYRQSRLFGFACVRRVWHLLTDKRYWNLIEVAERHADCMATDVELRAAISAAHRARRKGDLAGRAAYEVGRYYPSAPFEDVGLVLQNVAWAVANVAVPVCPPRFVARFVGDQLVTEEVPLTPARGAWEAARVSEHTAQCRLLRDIMGNPFRPPPFISSSVLACNDGCVVKMAQAIYQERTFSELPVLADALEEAGCDDEEILSHCREQEGVHARGCWVLDLLLQKD